MRGTYGSWRAGVLALVAAGCGQVADAPPGAADEVAASRSSAAEGARLFSQETFGGNGRTCRTCHSDENGTLTLEQIAELHDDDPAGPLFRGDGTDDGQGNGTTRVRQDGTILVTLPLPDGVTLVDDPTATTVTLRRGIPTTMNTPGLDPVLMYDGRAPDLEEQALAAITDHAAFTIAPTVEQLELLAAFQRTDEFFTTDALEDFAHGGPPPELPEGTTDAERRGRAFFDDVPLDPPSTRGMCAICHSGPLLNTSNGFNPIPVPPFFVPAGERFQSILSGEFLPNGDPLRAYAMEQPDGSVIVVASTDPGRAMTTGDFRPFPFGDLGEFKIPTLWGVTRTAPYFHNNGAKTIDDVLEHYDVFFNFATPLVLPGEPPIDLTEQDKADLEAFLALLDG